MKTTKLFLTFALIGGLLQSAFAQTTVHISGQLTNTGGAAISLALDISDGPGNWQSATVITNSSGNFSHSFSVSSNQGTAYLWGSDCNNDTIYWTDTYSLNDTLLVIPTIDYCPPTPTNCHAYFDINQATTANGNNVAGTLVVTDSSSGGTAINPLTYSWSFGDGNTGTGTQLTHTYSGNGPYQICLTVSDGLGCTDTYCDTVSVDSLGMIIEAEGFTLVIGEYDAPLSINNTSISNSINIFPNPATDFVNIQFNAGEKALNRITMYDLSGKVVFEDNGTNTSANMVTIDTENIEPGTYLIQMLFDNEIHNQKVILK